MSRISLWGLVALVATTPAAFAESVQLSNGDVIQGQVVSLDEQNLVIKSEVLGELSIKRSEVEAIHLGNNPPPYQSPRAGSADSSVPDESYGGTNSSPLDDLGLPSLKLDGDASPLQQLPQLMPLLKNPDVQKNFQKNLNGILSGEIDLQDLRGQAQNAREMMQEYEKELGPNSEIVEGYLNILDRLLESAEPSFQQGQKSETESNQSR